MEHRDFHIGIEFWSGGKRWRCADVGTRVITAISLEPHAVVEVDTDENGAVTQRICMTDDSSWHRGPPYPIVEHVFDEDGIEGCSLVLDRDVIAKRI